MLQVGEVLAARAMVDLILGRLVSGTKSGTELWLQGAQKAIILVPHDFALAGAKRIRNKGLDDYTASGPEGSRGWLRQRWRTETEMTALRALPAEGSTRGGQFGGIKRKQTRVLRRHGGVCRRPDR